MCLNTREYKQQYVNLGSTMPGVEIFENIKITRYIKMANINLTFVGPCIVIYFYSKPPRCTVSQIYFILEQYSTCFERSFRPSSGV